MIYFIHGDDRDAVLKKSKEILAGAKAKRKDAELFRFEEGQWDQAAFEGLIGGLGLFETKYIVECADLFENSDAKEFLLERIESLAGAEHLFLFMERKVDKKTLEALTTHAVKTYAYPMASFIAKPEYNSFAITDAFASRDRERAWVLLSDAFARSVAPEEVSGTLFWQLKTLLLVKRGIAQKESGLKEFPYKKALEASKRFTLDELVNTTTDLVFSYHKAHEGKVKLEHELERIVLS